MLEHLLMAVWPRRHRTPRQPPLSSASPKSCHWPCLVLSCLCLPMLVYYKLLPCACPIHGSVGTALHRLPPWRCPLRARVLALLSVGAALACRRAGAHGELAMPRPPMGAH